MSTIQDALTAQQRRTLISRSQPKSYAKGETIYSVGMNGTSAYIIATGKVEVSVTSPSGKRTLLSLMGPGEILGDIAMLDGGPRSADASALTDTSGHVLTRKVFLDILEEDTGLGLALIHALCAKLRALTDIHADQSVTEAPRRLARTILRLFAKWGRTGEDGVEVLGVTDHSLFHSIYVFDPNGHRVELACPDPQEAALLARLDAVKWEMLEEWSRTKRAPRHAAWLHEKQLG